MSRAFVKEHDGDAPDDLPERPVSEHPNFVTAQGLAHIENQVRELERERDAARAAEDKTTLARVDRDLRYWLQRKSTAKVVAPEADPQVVRFGVRVTVRYEGGDERSFTLVGEDEASPAEGAISWASPIGKALLGHEAGEEVVLQGRNAEIVQLEAPG